MHHFSLCNGEECHVKQHSIVYNVIQGECTCPHNIYCDVVHCLTLMLYPNWYGYSLIEFHAYFESDLVAGDYT